MNRFMWLLWTVVLTFSWPLFAMNNNEHYLGDEQISILFENQDKNEIMLEVIEKKSKNKHNKIEKSKKNIHYFLHMSVINNNFEGVQKALEEGALVNAQDKSGQTVLMMAVLRKRTDIIQLLLAYKADINLQDALGNTALHYAAMINNCDLIKLLLKNNGDPEIKNKENKKPSNLIKNPEIWEMLLNNEKKFCILF